MDRKHRHGIHVSVLSSRLYDGFEMGLHIKISLFGLGALTNITT